jgi:amyloid beta A4 protein
VAVLDCSKKYPNVYYDLERKEWSVHSADSKCFNSEKELLDLCKIVYPKLNIVNIMKSDEPVKFTVYGCTNGDRLSNNNNNNNNVLTLSNSKLKNCSKLKIKSVFPYKCLHGEFQSSELFIPPKCQFQHLYSNDACQSQEYWKILSKTKCESSNSNLNTSMLLQWCDASTSGVAMFSGIEFVCCPLNDDSINSNPQINEDEDIDDDDDVDENEEENEDNDDEAAALDEDQDTESITSVDNLDDYNLITPINKSNKIINQKDELSLDDLKNAVNKLNNLEENQLESVEGTQEQKNEYEKQKQLIINSIQFSVKNVII